MKLDKPTCGLSHLGLQRDLRPAARRIRRVRRLQAFRALAWQSLGLAACIVAIGIALPAVALPALYACVAIVAGGALWAWAKTRYQDYDYKEAARLIEAKHPDLKQALLTAVHVQLTGQSDFFSQRATAQALTHHSRPQWEHVGSRWMRRQALGLLSPIVGAAALLALASFSANWSAAHRNAANPPLAVEPSFELLPGDVTVERGSSLVVTAQFTGDVPREVTLATLSDSGTALSEPMTKSLADPIFAYTLQQISESLHYKIELASGQSQEFRIEVYDLPALLQADATLSFPGYTGWPDREIKDTRRIGAIEGSRLSYRFNSNKPLSKAALLDAEGNQIELSASNPQGTQFVYEATLESSARYRLLLTDLDDRSNPFPDDIRIEVQPNRRPEFRIEHPQSDQRLSPLEELALIAHASDDFALLDYGVAFSVGIEPPNYNSLADKAGVGPLADARIEHAIALETENLAPDDLVNWYFWADDHDANGAIRRTRSDLFFADIRPFDEIYREQDGGGGGGQEGGEAQEILEQQRRISISLFNLRNESASPEDASEDLDTILEAQSGTRASVANMAPMLQDPTATQSAEQALLHMEDVVQNLNTALQGPSLDPIEPALIASQSAFQELLKLNAKEYNVSRSQNGGGEGGPSRQRGQLDELEFRQEESRYQRTTQAQPPQSAQEQQDLQLLAKLNELSRRQQDLNERLREAQSAMAAAETEVERERIQRELKRLEEEQRRMLADTDEAIQQSGQSARNEATRQQLEQARENMRQAAEQMEGNEPSQALSAGARAAQNIDRSREETRQRSASQFSDAMRQARSEARRIQEEHQALADALADELSSPLRRLDGTDERQEISEEMDTLQSELESLMSELRQVTEDSEAGEPGLHRRLYDLMREQQTNRTAERLGIGSQLARQGLLEQSLMANEEISDDLASLAEGVESAAESILGSETASLRYAQAELDALTEALQNERRPAETGEGVAAGDAPAGDSSPSSQGADGSPSSQEPSGGPSAESSGQTAGSGGSSGSGNAGGAGAADLGSALQRSLEAAGAEQDAPLSGEGFADWTERMMTVESLMESDDVRQRLAQARESAEDMRRDFARRSQLPQWEMVESEIIVPLENVKSWIQQELIRAENPDTLQAIDRDPVPQEYTEAVRRYYEALGATE